LGIQGETANELFSYPPKDQEVSLVQAFREGIQWKAARKGKRAVSDEEQSVLAVTALEQEVNNGGYDQFLSKFVPGICCDCRRVAIACRLQETGKDH
jgi:Domain of unknown function (DUF4375)